MDLKTQTLFPPCQDAEIEPGLWECSVCHTRWRGKKIMRGCKGPPKPGEQIKPPLQVRADQKNNRELVKTYITAHPGSTLGVITTSLGPICGCQAGLASVVMAMLREGVLAQDEETLVISIPTEPEKVETAAVVAEPLKEKLRFKALRNTCPQSGPSRFFPQSWPRPGLLQFRQH